MGYRQYIYEFDKSLVEGVRKCKTEDELCAFLEKTSPNAVEHDFDGEKYAKLYDIGTELYEFGKYFEYSDEMYKHGDSLFMSEELNERYSDYGPIVLDPDGILGAIEFYRKKVAGIYEDLLREKSENEWDDRSQFDRLLSHARDYLHWWKPTYGYSPGNLNVDNPCIVNSWLYEHGYFELIRIYKTFDWENKSMVFMGW